MAEAWLKYLREELPTVAFKCSTQKQASNLGQRHLPKAQSSDSALQGSECLGANTLLQLLKNYTRNSDSKTAITVGKNSLTQFMQAFHCISQHAAVVYEQMVYFIGSLPVYSALLKCCIFCCSSNQATAYGKRQVMHKSTWVTLSEHFTLVLRSCWVSQCGQELPAEQSEADPGGSSG